MWQPLGFVNPNFPRHVCRLKKSMYGLKQVLKHGFIVSIPFFFLKVSYAARSISPCLSTIINPLYLSYFFMWMTCFSRVIILLLIHSFILSTQFAMKDLWDLHYFLGVQVECTSSRLFLSQHKYVPDLLRKFHLLTLNLCIPHVFLELLFPLLMANCLLNVRNIMAWLGHNNISTWLDLTLLMPYMWCSKKH